MTGERREGSDRREEGGREVTGSHTLFDVIQFKRSCNAYRYKKQHYTAILAVSSSKRLRLKCPVLSLNKSIRACLNHLFAAKKAAALSTCVCVCAYLSCSCSTL